MRPIAIVSIDDVLITYFVATKRTYLFDSTIYHANHLFGKLVLGFYHHKT